MFPLTQQEVTGLFPSVGQCAHETEQHNGLFIKAAKHKDTHNHTHIHNSAHTHRRSSIHLRIKNSSLPQLQYIIEPKYTI